MSPMPANRRLGILLVLTSALAWSSSGFFTRLLTLDSWTMITGRGLCGALGLLVAITILERRAGLRRLWRMGWQGWLLALALGSGMILFVTALRHTTVAHVTVIYATLPFFAAALAWITIAERPSRRAIVTSFAALSGVALMVGFGAEGGWFGDLLAFVMTLLMAGGMVLMRRFPNLPSLQAACVAALLSGLFAWPFGTIGSVSWAELGIVAVFGVSGLAVGLALFMLGARRLPAIESALIGSLDAPLSILWVWLAFGEAPSAATFLGALVVFTAVVTYITAKPAKPG